MTPHAGQPVVSAGAPLGQSTSHLINDDEIAFAQTVMDCVLTAAT